MLTLDAFARCWVQERVLLDAIGRRLPDAKRAPYARLVAEWTARNIARFDASMRVLADQLAHAACDREPVALPSTTSMQKLMHSVGLKHTERDAAHERAMKKLAERLDARIRAATDALTELHGLDRSAAQTVLDRVRANFAVQERIDEGRSALLGSVIMGALTGLKADIVSGGLTLGGGMLAGGLIGGLTGAGVARGMNRLARTDHPEVRWSADFLDALTRSSVLRYLAVAHFGRGRGRYVEGEAPGFWRQEVEQQFAARASEFHALWNTSLEMAVPETLAPDLLAGIRQTTVVDFAGPLSGHRTRGAAAPRRRGARRLQQTRNLGINPTGRTA